MVNQLEGTGLVDISAGNGHTLVLNENGEVFAFGKASEGQLGTNQRSIAQCNTAMQVKDNGLGDCIITKIVAGDGCSAAISNHGELFEWGFIHTSPHANEAQAASNALPGLVEQARNRVSDRLKALLRDSELEYLMGAEGGKTGAETATTEAEAGILAVRTRRQRAYAPVKSMFKHSVKDIALGFGHCLVVVRGDETLWAKGYNDRGQLGVGTRVNEVEFVPVLGELKNQRIASIACGSAHNLVITRDTAHMYSWGSNVLGQLGLSAGVADQLWPARVALLGAEGEEEFAEQIACGSYHSVVLSTAKTLFSFGHAEYGQHGALEENEAHGDFRHLSRHYFTPQRVWRFHSGDISLKQILVGQQYNAAVDDQGRVWTWGFGASGNLGHGKKQRSTAPQAIEALIGHKILRITAGHKHMLVLTAPEGNPFALQNMHLLNNSNEGFDSELCSSNGGNAAKCHKAMITVRCPALLAYGSSYRFVLPVATESLVIRALLEYIYCDVLRSCPPHRLKDLRDLAVSLQLPRLAALCSLQRYQRYLREGFLIQENDATVTSAEQVPKSTFSQDMLRLVDNPVEHDALLAAADYVPRAVLPPGHTWSTWNTSSANFIPQGHTALTWRGINNSQVVFKTHKFLFQRYMFFSVLLQGKFREGEIVRAGGVVRLETLANFEALQWLQQWIYSGSVCGGIHENNVAELLHASLAFGVADLARACERFLLQVLHVDNAEDILLLATEHFLPKLAKECKFMLNQ